MDNIALCVTKAITDLLEQNEGRFRALQTNQDAQLKQIADLQAEIERLNVKCQLLTNEKEELRSKLDQNVLAQEKLDKQADSAERESGRARKQVDHMENRLSKWEQLTTTIANRVKDLCDDRDLTKETIQRLEVEQNDLGLKLRRQVERNRTDPSHGHLYSPSVTRSPSASSYLHQHPSATKHGRRSQIPNNQYQEHVPNNYLDNSFDAREDLSVISDHADNMMRQRRIR